MSNLEIPSFVNSTFQNDINFCTKRALFTSIIKNTEKNFKNILWGKYNYIYLQRTLEITRRK